MCCCLCCCLHTDTEAEVNISGPVEADDKLQAESHSEEGCSAGGRVRHVRCRLAAAALQHCTLKMAHVAPHPPPSPPRAARHIAHLTSRPPPPSTQFRAQWMGCLKHRYSSTIFLRRYFLISRLCRITRQTREYIVLCFGAPSLIITARSAQREPPQTCA